MPEIKPGYKTTEFWLTLASEITAVLLVSDVITSAEGLKWLAASGAILARVLYVLSRAKAKSA